MGVMFYFVGGVKSEVAQAATKLKYNSYLQERGRSGMPVLEAVVNCPGPISRERNAHRILR